LLAYDVEQNTDIFYKDVPGKSTSPHFHSCNS
jgi:hypothetical protein